MNEKALFYKRLRKSVKQRKMKKKMRKNTKYGLIHLELYMIVKMRLKIKIKFYKMKLQKFYNQYL